MGEVSLSIGRSQVDVTSVMADMKREKTLPAARFSLFNIRLFSLGFLTGVSPPAAATPTTAAAAAASSLGFSAALTIKPRGCAVCRREENGSCFELGSILRTVGGTTHEGFAGADEPVLGVEGAGLAAAAQVEVVALDALVAEAPDAGAAAVAQDARMSLAPVAPQLHHRRRRMRRKRRTVRLFQSRTVQTLFLLSRLID